jgi:RNA polymerase sigma-70 factor (ECF subfamily)
MEAEGDAPDDATQERMGVPSIEARARRIEGGSAQEARLIAACQEGDASAFNLLVRRWEGPLFNFVYKYVGDAAVAQDLVQDTFVRVVKSIGRYGHRGAFSSWLFSIAVNLCKDHLRRKKRRSVVSLHDYYTTVSGRRISVRDEVPDEDARTDAAAEAADREKLVRRLLAGLSDDQRIVVLLREYQALTFPEIAEVLGVPENTAKARLHRGLRAMRRRLEEEGMSPEDASGGA